MSDPTADGAGAVDVPAQVMARATAVLAAHARKGRAVVGEAVDVRPDVLLAGPEDAAAIHALWNEGGGKQARSARRCVWVDGDGIDLHVRARLESFAETFGATLGPDVARAGVPAVVATDEGLITSDALVAACDPEAGALGGIGALVLRADVESLSGLLVKPSLKLPVPPSARVHVTGKLPRWTGPLDLAVLIRDRLDGSAAGHVLQLEGPCIDGLDVPARMALCARLADLGHASLVPPDESTRVWCAARRVAGGDDDPPNVSAGPEVPIEGEPLLVGARAAQMVVLRGRKAVPVQARGGEPIREVLVTGRIEELRVLSEAVSERHVAPGVALRVVPANRRAMQHALDEGVAASLLRAGAHWLEPGARPLARVPGTRLVTRPTRHADERLVGFAVAGASAVAGRIIDPESMRREQRRVSSRR